MTALKPIDSLRVKGVAANRYRPNDVCAHPECAEPATDNHHIFPRSLIGNASWFVILEDGLTETTPEKGGGYRQAIPHVAGLCRMHHEQVELHFAWIKYEEGVFVWYDRAQVSSRPNSESGEPWIDTWISFGPLDPQPGDRTKQRKPKPKNLEPAKPRQTKSVRCPKDAGENGIEVLESLIEQAGEKLAPEMGWSDSPPDYHVLVAALYFLIQNYAAEEAA